MLRAEVDDKGIYYLEDGPSKWEEKKLLKAVEEHNISEVERLLSIGAYVDVVSKEGKTPLMIAAQNKDIEIAKLLISKRADINARNQRWTLPLFIRFSVLDYAVLSGDTAIVNYLIKTGAELNFKKKGGVVTSNNPVVIATQTLNIRMVKYLLDIGCKVSEEERRDLIVHSIIFSGERQRIARNDNGGLLVRFWMNYGRSFTEKELLESRLLKGEGERDEKLRRQVKSYLKYFNREDVQIKEEKILYSKLKEDFEPSREQELKKKKEEEDQARTKEEYKIWEQQNAETQSKRVWIITFFLIVALSLSVYIYRKYLFPSAKISQNPPPQQSPVTNTANKTPINRRTALPRPVITPSKSKSEHQKPAKGWQTDNTTNIEISFLTIEDMINPIRLANEYEKAVKEMIRYIRLLGKYNDDQINQILGEKGLSFHLNNLWAVIDPEYVRNVYKRSLYILVDNYSERDNRVKAFLDKIHKKKEVKKSNRKKKKSEKKSSKK